MARGLVYWVEFSIPISAGFIDTGEVYLNLDTPGVDILESVDASTVYLDLQPSGIDAFGVNRRGIVYWAEFTVPVSGGSVDYDDLGTALLRLTPSGVDVYNNTQIYQDLGTVYLDIRVSASADTAQFVDAVAVYMRLIPQVTEEYTTPPPPEIPVEPSIISPAPYVAPRSWKIIHKNHAGDELGEIYPENFRFGIFLSKPGFVNYDIDLESELGRLDNTRPFWTDWELRRGNDLVKDLAGFHTEVQVSEVESTFIQVAGQTWLHYFEHIFWPFNPANPLQYAYTAAATDLFTIVDAILDTVLAQSDALAFTYSFGTSGQTTNFKVEAGDQENILSKIDQLAKLDPGFDIYVTPARVIQLFAPKKGIDRDVTFELNQNVELINYTDKGSKPVLKGFGSANSQRAGDVEETTGRRRYEEMKDYGEVASQSALEEAVAADQARLEVTNIQFSVRWTGRSEEDDLLDQVDVGDTVPVYGETGYDLIDGEYRIVGIEGEVSDEANADYVVTFDDGTLSL